MCCRVVKGWIPDVSETGIVMTVLQVFVRGSQKLPHFFVIGVENFPHFLFVVKIIYAVLYHRIRDVIAYPRTPKDIVV